MEASGCDGQAKANPTRQSAVLGWRLAFKTQEKQFAEEQLKGRAEKQACMASKRGKESGRT
jgi:hypothetical protein